MGGGVDSEGQHCPSRFSQVRAIVAKFVGGEGGGKFLRSCRRVTVIGTAYIFWRISRGGMCSGYLRAGDRQQNAVHFMAENDLFVLADCGSFLADSPALPFGSVAVGNCLSFEIPRPHRHDLH